MATSRIIPVTAYRQTANSTARWQEELIWQRALRRLEGPARPPAARPAAPPKKPGVFSRLRHRLGRHLGLYVDITV
ncbi:MAG TPA: hypothetical protein VF194_00285 [Ferrovibrio sp.]|jgi:hypothetical protein|uniref:hypothetical protein n=1 Tax=Ferrovibrio sp. TaxID=1917215 RepID=UPI002ED5583E